MVKTNERPFGGIMRINSQISAQSLYLRGKISGLIAEIVESGEIDNFPSSVLEDIAFGLSEVCLSYSLKQVLNYLPDKDDSCVDVNVEKGYKV